MWLLAKTNARPDVFMRVHKWAQRVLVLGWPYVDKLSSKVKLRITKAWKPMKFLLAISSIYISGLRVCQSI